MTRLGTQLLVECYACDAEILHDHGRLLHLLAHDALGLANWQATAGYVHAFTPYGLSAAFGQDGIMVTLHTWPEHGHLTIDVFSIVRPLDVDRIRHALGAGLQTEAISVLSQDRRVTRPA